MVNNCMYTQDSRRLMKLAIIMNLGHKIVLKPLQFQLASNTKLSLYWSCDCHMIKRNPYIPDFLEVSWSSDPCEVLSKLFSAKLVLLLLLWFCNYNSKVCMKWTVLIFTAYYQISHSTRMVHYYVWHLYHPGTNKVYNNELIALVKSLWVENSEHFNLYNVTMP